MVPPGLQASLDLIKPSVPDRVSRLVDLVKAGKLTRPAVG